MQNYDENILLENIKQLMKQKRVSQEQLANILHTGQPTVCKILNGNTATLSFEFVYQAACLLGVTLDELCKQPTESQEETPSEETADNESSETTQPSLYEVCSALAIIFKSCYPTTKDITYTEEAWIEATDEYGRDMGIYAQHREKQNIYTALFFSNYSKPDYTMDHYDDYEEYWDDLREYGNEHTSNRKVNVFLRKLSTYLKNYQDDIFTYDTYTHVIDEALSQIKK